MPVLPDPDRRVRSRGLELQATTSLTDRLDLTAAYTFNDVEVIEDTQPEILGNRPVLTPEHMASMWLDYTFAEGPIAGLNVGAGARYVGSTFADAENTIENDAYFLMDAALRYDLGEASPALKGAELAVNATNLLGEEYTVCYSVFDCKWGAERTVMATLTYRW